MNLATKKLKDLVAADYNPRKDLQPGDPEYESLKKSIKRWGLVEPIVWNKHTGHVCGGHQRLKILLADGVKETEVVVVDLPEKEEKALNLALNKIRGDWDYGKLMFILDEMVVAPPEGMDIETTGFSMEDIAELEAKTKKGQAKEDNFNGPEERAKIKKPETKIGDLYILGEHRLLCGDAIKVEDVKRLLEDIIPVTILTDPPYCSGGFQEAGRARGSIGSGAKIIPRIAGDMLSTRGYKAIVKSAIFNVNALSVYIFTDWRMWINTFDVMEESGYGVRSMIVWDKESPGMGIGWRSQHELILFATRSTLKFDNHKSIGNVLHTSRTGNLLHPTQKPVELIGAILGVMDMADTIYDPFAGSGTTLIAAEQLGRKAYLMEIDPGYCDVIVKRWEQFTGKEARLLNRPRGG